MADPENNDGAKPTGFWPGIEQWAGPHWEECRFDPVRPRPGYFPDWKFSVLTYDRPGGVLLCEFHLYLSLNRAGQEYVLNHSRWKKDMRPLILWGIREILLKVKIAEAEYGVEERHGCGLEDPERGITFSGAYWTKRAFDSEGVTWIHLTNYANTHITDSFKQVAEDNPDSVPTSEELAAAKRKLREEWEQTRRENEEAQRMARASRRHGQSSLSIFLDESGDPGFRQSGFYISTALFLPTEEVNRLRAALAHVLELGWFRQTAPAELHFSKMAPAKQERVSRLLSLIVRRLNCRVLIYITPKRAFLRRLSRSEAEFNRGHDYPIGINWGELLASNKTAAANWLLAYLLDETVSHIVIENLEEVAEVLVTHDRKRFDWQNEALVDGAEIARATLKGYVREVYGEEDIPRIEFGCKASESEPCLWITDWIGWEIQRYLKSGSPSAELTSILPVTNSLIIDEEGIKVSVDLLTRKRLHAYPDLPRDMKGPQGRPDAAAS